MYSPDLTVMPKKTYHRSILWVEPPTDRRCRVSKNFSVHSLEYPVLPSEYHVNSDAKWSKYGALQAQLYYTHRIDRCSHWSIIIRISGGHFQLVGLPCFRPNFLFLTPILMIFGSLESLRKSLQHGTEILRSSSFEKVQNHGTNPIHSTLCPGFRFSAIFSIFNVFFEVLFLQIDPWY